VSLLDRMVAAGQVAGSASVITAPCRRGRPTGAGPSSGRGERWRIEECFAAAKNEAGLASYQVRDYTAWYRHITLAMLAHACLSATRATVVKGASQPEPSSSSR
jgi:hypothetical protein